MAHGDKDIAGVDLATRIQQLERQFADTLRSTISGLRGEIQERLRETTSALEDRLGGLDAVVPASLFAEDELRALARAEASRAGELALSSLRDDLRALEAARSQGDFLAALLEAAHQHAPRAALFLTQEQGVVGWSSRGFDTSAAPLGQLAKPYTDALLFERLMEGRGAVELSPADCGWMASWLEAPVGADAFLLPILLDDRLAAALYVDRTAGDPPLTLAPLQILAWSAGQTLELLPLRTRAASPALYREDEPGTEELPALTAWAAPAEDAIESVALEAPVAVAAGVTAILAPELPAEEAHEEEVFAGDWSQPSIGHEVTGGLAWGTSPRDAEPDEDDVAPPAEAVTEIGPLTAFEGIDAPFTAQEEETALPELAPAFAEPSFEPMPEAADAEALDVPSPSFWEPAPAPAEPAALEVAFETPATFEAAAELRYAADLDGDLLTPLPSLSDEPASALTFESEPSVVAAPEPAPAFEPLPSLEPAFGSGSPAATAPLTPPVDLRQAGGLQTLGFPVMDVNADETVLLRRPPADTAAMQGLGSSPPAPAPAAPVSPLTEPAPSRAGGSVEVRPPSDFQGRGSAFGFGQPTAPQGLAGSPAQHEEARRLARLLIAEIRLYNEDQVEEGRRNGDILARLREDIERSRQMYRERTDRDVLASSDYFGEELVRILADNDPRLLGT
jgi:hypothetical protein